jgi:hypothetical protein
LNQKKLGARTAQNAIAGGILSSITPDPPGNFNQTRRFLLAGKQINGVDRLSNDD